MGGQGIHRQDAFIRKAPLAAWDESCQELAICRNVTAGIIVDLAVLYQDIHGGCSGQRKGERLKHHATRNSETKMLLGLSKGGESSLEMGQAALFNLKCWGAGNRRDRKICASTT